MKVPFIPDAAPFSPDQRAWISGYVAGLQASVALNLSQAAAAEAPAQALDLNILFGTQTGNAETVALDAADISKTRGFTPTVAALDDVSMEALEAMERVIVVISTYGEGEMPDSAQLFWDALSASTAPRLENTSFGVLALGDTGYDEFCHAGKLVDMRLEQLGAKRLTARVDCDVDFEDPAAEWIDGILPLIGGTSKDDASDPEPATAGAGSPAAKSVWSRKNPYPATVLENRRLSGSASAKEIRHFAFSLEDSGITYEAGDALGVIPRNDMALVDAMIERLGASAQTPVDRFDLPLRDVLARKLEISVPHKDFVLEVARRSGDEELGSIVANGDKEALESFLWGRDTLDLLCLCDGNPFTLDAFLDLLKPLQHRAYSISSSPAAHPGEVHLTVAAVRWTFDGRLHNGVCSAFLSDRVAEGDAVPVFVSPNRAFRVPGDDTAPMIMVGPGTGIAPFRAFLEDRRERGATGRNWLFFGDQRRAQDFIYEDEIGRMSADGRLTRLDLAFSRDQSEKIYVQSRMRENGRALFSWLQDGGHFYVCGDATRMARDVDQALHEIVADQGGLSQDAAAEYVNTLKREKRYVRDVY